MVTAALIAAPLSALAPAIAHADTAPPATSPDAAALTQAQATGKSVPVDADTTATSTTVANPDGTFTYTATPVPTRVQQNGSWVPVDASLQAVTGGYAPKAAESSVLFSSGGTGPLATISNAAGQSVSVAWPSALPAPTVSGATATYANVYPGVDLQMTATTDGGYTEHLVVKDATAAANPALTDIHLDTSTSAGLTLSRNQAGGLQATDSSGNAVFSSPTATMWDTPANAAGAATTQGGAAKLSAQSLSSTPASGSASSQDGADQVTPIAVNVSGSGVDLVPPAGSLTAAGNTYPLVIDPSLTPKEQGWTWTSSVNSGTSYWQGSNNTNDTNAHVGYDDWCSNGASGCTAFGVTRSLFNLDTTPLMGKHVTSATVSITEQGPTSSWSGTRQIDLHGANNFDNTTTWNTQSIWSTVAATGNFASINSTATGNANFDVTGLIQSAVANGYTRQNIALQAHDETDDTAYRYLLGGTLQTQVTFWSTPVAPADPPTVTNSGSTANCSGTSASPNWVNANDSRTVTLNASIPSPDSYTNGTTEDGAFWYQQEYPSVGNWTSLTSGQVVMSANPQPVSETMPTLKDGDEYRWHVIAENPGGYYSSPVPANSDNNCWIRVDMTPPTAGITGTPQPPTTVGGSGNFTVTGADSGTNPSGVAKIVYNIGGTSLTSGGGGEQSVNASSFQIPLTGGHWGTNTVWYAAVDAAGNQSVPQHYDYYVIDTAYTPGTAGDLDGDHIPDLAAVDASGNIRVYSDPLSKTPDTAGAVALHNSQAPNGTTFAGSILAHNGSFTSGTCDDLVIIQGGSLNLAQNVNCTGTGMNLTTAQARPTSVTGDQTNYNQSDWSNVRQAVVLPPTAPGGKPALVTLEDANGVPTLWLMTAVSQRFVTATLLATGSALNNLTLISPGIVNGSPALWTRNTVTGALTQYLNIEADTPASMPGTAIAPSGYTLAAYPTITSSGPIGSAGGGAGTGPALWATTANDTLELITTSVDTNGNVTLQAPVQMSSPNWNGGIRAPGSFADVADWNKDGKPDLLATDGLGNLWSYPDTGTPNVALTGNLLGSGFTGYTFAGVADMNGDGYPDLVAEDPSGGLWLYPGDAAHDLNTPRIKIGYAWQSYSFAGVRDWNADGHPDIVAKDSSGVLWMYPANADGTLGSRVQIGSYFGTYTLDGLVDWNKDGHMDLLATDSNGTVWLYTGDAAHDTSGGRTQIATGWNSTTAGLADWTGDTNPDLIALDPTGNLWVYPGTGTLTAPGARTPLPVQW
ncbi:FG-GAP-like repeat-containing protein [Streptacidiphilus sp. MAP12-33]|uniref:FG-GAP-like repeat-containing protein n=1 Tax=Streptacidiphilus sp. MAP12-33 TaxID=3156266 RepID=UPI003515160D